MARKLRVQYPGAIYHVMNRGDWREPIFKDDTDRQRFLETEIAGLTTGVAAGGTVVGRISDPARQRGRPERIGGGVGGRVRSRGCNGLQNLTPRLVFRGQDAQGRVVGGGERAGGRLALWRGTAGIGRGESRADRGGRIQAAQVDSHHVGSTAQGGSWEAAL